MASTEKSASGKVTGLVVDGVAIPDGAEEKKFTTNPYARVRREKERLPTGGTVGESEKRSKKESAGSGGSGTEKTEKKEVTGSDAGETQTTKKRAKPNFGKVLTHYAYNTLILLIVALVAVFFSTYVNGIINADYAVLIVKETVFYSIIAVLAFIFAGAIYRSFTDEKTPELLVTYMVHVIATGLILFVALIATQVYLPQFEHIVTVILQKVHAVGGLRLYYVTLTLLITNIFHLSYFRKFYRTDYVQNVIMFTATQVLTIMILYPILKIFLGTG